MGPASIPGYIDGTSIATPIVAACAALLRQARPNATRDQVLYALSQSPVAISFPMPEGNKIANAVRPRIDCPSALASLPATTPPPPPNLNQFGITGTWYNPATSGQGIAIVATPNLIAPGVGFINGGWFTFAPTVPGGAGSQRWYSFTGEVAKGTSSVALTILGNANGNFAAPPETSAKQVGTATLTLTTCESGSFAYNLNDGGGSGVIPLTRLTPNLSCTASGSGGSSHPDYLRTGTYMTAGLSGQGLYMELNPGTPLINMGWYTYGTSEQVAA